MRAVPEQGAENSWREEDEVRGGWRKLHNEELHDFNSSLSITRIMKSRRMRLAGHVVRIGEKGNAFKLLAEKPEGNTTT
jgi:hypothetical protein